MIWAQIFLQAFQINPDVINANIQDRTGMGETGEAYLVGMDFMMRSISLLEEEPSALRVKVDTEMTRLWRSEHAVNLTENHHEEVLHYTGRNGRQVIEMHHSIEIAGVPMVIIVEIEASEAFAASNRLGLMVIALVVVTSADRYNSITYFGQASAEFVQLGAANCNRKSVNRVDQSTVK